MNLRPLALAALLAAACATTPAPAPAPPTPAPPAPASPAPAPPAPPVDAPAPPAAPVEEPAAPPVVEAPPPPPPPVHHRPDGPVEEGLASYYADMLAGHPTASGEKYKPELRTCAHRTQPFGTVLKVTVIKSGRSSTCRVNDRGPNTKKRILDVSKKVARELGMVGPGVLQVRVRAAGDG